MKRCKGIVAKNDIGIAKRCGHIFEPINEHNYLCPQCFENYIILTGGMKSITRINGKDFDKIVEHMKGWK